MKNFVVSFKFHFNQTRMKVSKVLLFILVMIKLSESQVTLVPQAIQQVIKNHFLKNSVKFYVICKSKETKNIDKILKSISEVSDFRLIEFYEEFDSRISAIVLLDSFLSFLEFETITESFEGNNDVLIYYNGMTAEEIKSNFPFHWNHFRTYLIVEDNEIVLYGAPVFTPQQCHMRQLVEINRFSTETQTWSTDKFFTTMIEDFFGCEVTFMLLKDISYTIAEDRKSYKLHGYLVKMVNALSTTLNFEIDYNLCEEEDFKTDKGDFILTMVIIKELNDEHKSAPVFMSSAAVIVVPLGAPYTPLEKLLLPFDELTWILILTFFGTAFATVALLRFKIMWSIKKRVVGPNVTTPGLNIFRILMGISTKILPKANIARFMMMNFILFCLIMRTAYQGKYFEFLTSIPRKKPITTFEELAEKNFPIYYETIVSEQLEELGFK